MSDSVNSVLVVSPATLNVILLVTTSAKVMSDSVTSAIIVRLVILPVTDVILVMVLAIVVAFLLKVDVLIVREVVLPVTLA